jgi:hypothetical protein
MPPRGDESSEMTCNLGQLSITRDLISHKFENNINVSSVRQESLYLLDIIP